MKHYREMQQRQRARRDCTGRKHNCVATSTGGEMTPERRRGGDDISWTDVNLTGPKNEENSHS
jgi:hypothetical protein